MRQLDLDALRIVDSRIDIDAVTALREPMLQVQEAIDGLDQAMADSQNGWLVPPVADRLTELAVEVDDQQVVAQRALDALDVAPAVLGADGERVYFVMFTTPAEARGQGGFMGNYAEITIDQGRIEMTEFGRHTDLNDGGRAPAQAGQRPGGLAGPLRPVRLPEGPRQGGRRGAVVEHHDVAELPGDRPGGGRAVSAERRPGDRRRDQPRRVRPRAAGRVWSARWRSTAPPSR